MYGQDHQSVGLGFINLGMLHFINEEYQKAEVPLLKAIELFQRTNATKDLILSLGYYWLGRVYLESNQLSKAEREFRNSLKIREEIFPENNFRIWSTRDELGVCLLKQKDILNQKNYSLDH